MDTTTLLPPGLSARTILPGYADIDPRFPEFGLHLDTEAWAGQPLDLLRGEHAERLARLVHHYGVTTMHLPLERGDLEGEDGWHQLSNDFTLYRSWHADVAVDHVLMLALPTDSPPRRSVTGVCGRQPAVAAMLECFHLLDFVAHLDDEAEVEWYRDTGVRLRELLEARRLYDRRTQDDGLVHDATYNCLRYLVENIGYHDRLKHTVMPAFLRAVNEALRPGTDVYLHQWRPGDVLCMSHLALHARVIPDGLAREDSSFYRRVAMTDPALAAQQPTARS